MDNRSRDPAGKALNDSNATVYPNSAWTELSTKCGKTRFTSVLASVGAPGRLSSEARGARGKVRYTDFSVCPSFFFLVRRYVVAAPVVGTSSPSEAVTDSP